MPERLYLGVDGGQSSTTALVANEHGRILGKGKGGPCNHAAAAEGRQKFLSAVGDCMREACAQASLSVETVSFAAVCFGLSGGSEDKRAYIHELIRSEKYKLTHDGEIALSGATGGEPGIIIISGTGSLAFGRNSTGKIARAGGWGYIYGDEGGAFDLTRRALRASLQWEEGWGPATLLHSLLLKATNTKSADELAHRFYGDVPRSKIATYAPLVTEAAGSGDVVAHQILRDAAESLVRYVSGVYQQLFTSDDVPLICPVGATFGSEPLRAKLTAAINSHFIASVTEPLYSPVVGALLEAFALDGLKLNGFDPSNVGATVS